METFANVFLFLLGLYLAVGIVFAVPFAFLGSKKIDPAAVKGTFGFKLLILPGAALLWPLLLRLWITRSSPPEEYSRHRKLARTPAPTPSQSSS